MKKILTVIWLLLAAISCSSSDRDAIESIIDEPERKTIDLSILGTNAFVNDGRFGGIREQFEEIRDVLGIRRVRVLFAWNNDVQPSPDSAPNFSFYDSIARRLPDDMEAVVVLTGVPSWMQDVAQWIDGNPRTTFVELWVRAVIERYGSNPKLSAFQIWNEPNQAVNADNTLLGMQTSAENYVEMLARAYSVIKDVAPNRSVLNAATTGIVQDFPNSLDYNKAMQNAGVESFVDIFAIHYYGTGFENFLRDGGVGEFLNQVNKPIWVTESGKQGVSAQLAYGEQVWPFITEQVPGIQRIYQYQFAEGTPAESTFGMKNLSGTPTSDLYTHIRDRRAAGE